jgi:hypothetical protein
VNDQGARTPPTPEQARLDAIRDAYDDSSCEACGEFHPEAFLAALVERGYEVRLPLVIRSELAQ